MYGGIYAYLYVCLHIYIYVCLPYTVYFWQLFWGLNDGVTVNTVYKYWSQIFLIFLTFILSWKYFMLYYL